MPFCFLHRFFLLDSCNDNSDFCVFFSYRPIKLFHLPKASSKRETLIQLVASIIFHILLRTASRNMKNYLRNSAFLSISLSQACGIKNISIKFAFLMHRLFKYQQSQICTNSQIFTSTVPNLYQQSKIRTTVKNKKLHESIRNEQCFLHKNSHLRLVPLERSSV